MRKTVGLLVVVVGLVAVLLLWMGSDDGERTGRHATEQVDAPHREGPAPAHSDASKSSTAPKTVAPDHDPNRIDGPDITLRGVVVRKGKPIAGATVQLFAARPWFRQSIDNWRRTSGHVQAPVGTSVPTGADGRFEAKTARRTQVAVMARAKGHGHKMLHLYVPDVGDPGELTIELEDAHALNVIVIKPDGTPVPNASVNLINNSWTSQASFQIETKTGGDGRTRFDDLAPGSYRVLAQAKGTARTTYSMSLPHDGDARIVVAPGGALHGRIALADDTPVAGAELLVHTHDEELRSRGVASGTTNEDGTYRIESVFPGRITSIHLKHDKLGHLQSSTQRWLLPAKPVAAGTALEFNLTLPVGSVLRGVVVGPDGSPAQARVTLLRRNPQNRGLIPVAYEETDAAGRFEFPYAEIGGYAFDARGDGMARISTRWPNGNKQITIDLYVNEGTPSKEQRVQMEPTGSVRGTHPQHNPRMRSVSLQNGTITASATLDTLGQFWFSHLPVQKGATVRSWNPEATSKPFDVEAGKTTQITLKAAEKLAFPVVVRDVDGKPIAGARVFAIPDARLRSDLQNALRNSWYTSVTDAQGRAEVTPQSWHLQQYKTGVWTVGAGKAGFVAQIEGNQRITDTMQEVVLVLDRGGRVAGTVRFEGGAPGERMTVSLAPVRAPRSKARTPRAKTNTQPPDTRAAMNTRTNATGGFSFEGVAHGKYRAYCTYANGKADSVTVTAGDLDVELIVKPTASIRGTVVTEEGEPISQGLIHALVPNERGERKHMGRIDQNGRFTITQLPEGAYAIVVAPQANQRYMGAPPVQGFVAKRVEDIATGRDDVEIVVSLGPALSGTVVGPGGKPAAGATVLAMPVKLSAKERRNSWNAKRPSASTDGRGNFKLRGVTFDEVELLVMHREFAVTTFRTDKNANDVRIQLARGETLELEIRSSDGTAYAGKWINLQMGGEVQKKWSDFHRRGGNTFQMLGGWNRTAGNTDGEGKITFRGLFAGEYSLTIHDQSAAAPPTKLRTGPGVQLITLEQPLSVRGRIVDADTNAPIEVASGRQVWVNVSSGATTKGARVASDGTFEVMGLPRGSVTVQVWGNVIGYNHARVTATAGDQNVTVPLKKAQTRK